MPGTVRPPSSAELNPPSGLAHAATNLGIVSSRIPEMPSSSQLMPKVCPTCGVRYPVEFKVCPRDAIELEDAATEEEQDPIVGQTLNGTYTIVRVVGEGGMGRVYEARHTRIASKHFAVKMLHPEFTRQTEVLSRFQREAEAAASIQSPYVVDMIDVDRTADGRPYLVTEFLEGAEFAEYLGQHGRMGASEVARIGRQICRALAVAHEGGIVHRDMKPENVFLTGDLTRPTVKVIDFGISKHGDKPGTALTKTGMIMGTPSYMAPEQARGERVDHRADIYAVGAILYAALTGQRPFDHEDPTAVLTAVLTRDPPRPRSIEPTIPEGLELVVQRAMAKDPAGRYNTMIELGDALAPYESTAMAAPGSSLPPPRFESVANEAEGARPTIALAGTVGALAILGLLLETITAIVRFSRGGGARANLTGAEAAFLVLGVFFAALTPAILVGRHIAQRVWANSAEAATLAKTLRAPVLLGLASYGVASLGVRVLDSVFVHHAVGVAWPFWDILLLAAAGAGVALGLRFNKKG